MDFALVLTIIIVLPFLILAVTGDKLGSGLTG